MNGRATSLGLLLCALLACGDAEQLSVGEVRCEGVSCARIEIKTIDGDFIEIEQSDREEVLVPVIGEQVFCGDPRTLSQLDGGSEPGSEPFCMGERLIRVGDEQFIVALKYLAKLDSERSESGLRLARYAGGELQWDSTELSREVEHAPQHPGDAFAIASGTVEGEAIVGVTHETGARYAYGQTFYAVKADGELVELFDDDTAGRIRALAALGEDIVVAGEYDGHVELTRYTTEGVLVWRQTTLTATEVQSHGPAVVEDTDVRVIDGKRIVVLAPLGSGLEVMELTAEGELVRSWTSWHGFEGTFLEGRLATGPSDQFFVGIDGYMIERCSLSGDEPRRDAFSKQRTQYWEPAVLGLHVDTEGYIYIATVDGDLERPFGLIERVSPDMSRRETFVIGDELAPEGLSLVIGGELFVTDDQRTLHFAAGGTLGSIELPPIED